MVSHKQVGQSSFTEPRLPSTRVVLAHDVLIEFYIHDHGPPHLHVTEFQGTAARTTKIGQNGHPLRGQPELTPKQRQVIREHRTLIRKVVRKYSRWFWYQELLTH